jgi:hypothetical protein
MDPFFLRLPCLERRQNMVSICRLVAWGLLIGDGLFTYFTLEAGGNKLFAASIGKHRYSPRLPTLRLPAIVTELQLIC